MCGPAYNVPFLLYPFVAFLYHALASLRMQAFCILASDF